MITLEYIEKFAKFRGACSEYLVPFKDAINDNDIKLAWQIVVINLRWLNLRELNISLDDIPINTDGRVEIYDLNDKIKHVYNLHNGVYHGPQIGYHDGIIKYIIYFKDGKRDGASLKFDNYGNLHIYCKYKDNRFHGKYREFYPSRKPKNSCIYVDGIKNGICKTYYRNGKKEFVGFYKDGSLSGKYTNYHKNGKISCIGSYND